MAWCVPALGKWLANHPSRRWRPRAPRGVPHLARDVGFPARCRRWSESLMATARVLPRRISNHGRLFLIRNPGDDPDIGAPGFPGNVARPRPGRTRGPPVPVPADDQSLPVHPDSVSWSLRDEGGPSVRDGEPGSTRRRDARSWRRVSHNRAEVPPWISAVGCCRSWPPALARGRDSQSGADVYRDVGLGAGSLVRRHDGAGILDQDPRRGHLGSWRAVSARAQASASRMAASVRSDVGSWAARTRSMVLEMPGKVTRPSTKAWTRTSSAALRTVG